MSVQKCGDVNFTNRKFLVKEENLHHLAEYRDYLRKHPRLTYLFFELTNQCNLHCIHCGSNCSSNKTDKLTFEEIKCVLKQVKERYGAQSVMICLTGGEPLLHPDFTKIVQYITEQGFPWGITTNATLIDANMLALFKSCGLQSISISIDGYCEENDWFRRCPGLYNVLIEKEKLLLQAGINAQVTTVVHKKNIASLELLRTDLEQIGVKSWRLVNFEPIGRALKHPELALNKDDYILLLDYIRNLRFSGESEMEISFGCSHYLTLEYEREVRDYYFICSSGIYVASVLSNGDIYSCLDIERRQELVQGNIRRDNFVDVWENRFQIFREDRTAHCAECIACKSREFCAGDSTHTWDFEHQRPILCYRKL